MIFICKRVGVSRCNGRRTTRAPCRTLVLSEDSLAVSPLTAEVSAVPPLGPVLDNRSAQRISPKREVQKKWAAGFSGDRDAMALPRLFRSRIQAPEALSV